MPELISGAGQTLEQVGQIQLIAGTRRSENDVAHSHEKRMNHNFSSKGGRLTGQAGDVTGLGVEELHPGVEMTHIGVGPIHVRLDFRIDRPDDVTRQQIVDDDGTVLEERGHNMLGPHVSVNSLELTVMNRRHGNPL
jgi:hypothetical protein